MKMPVRSMNVLVIGLSMLLLGGCASEIKVHTGAFAHPAAQTAFTAGRTAAPKGAPLARAHLKRPIQLAGFRHRRVGGASADASRSQATEGSIKTEECMTTLRSSLERALRNSGRYDVRADQDTTSASPDTMLLSVELIEHPQRFELQLRINDPVSSSKPLLFVGEGTAVATHNRVFGGTRDADAQKRARRAALDFAVRNALHKASAVLGMVPWQAPVLEIEDGSRILIAGGERMGLKPGLVLSLQTRENKIDVDGLAEPITLPGRVVGEVLIVENLGELAHNKAAVGTLVTGSLRGYDMRDLVVRFCRPNGYFGDDFGHDRNCSAKAAALVAYDPTSALLSFEPLPEEAEAQPTPYLRPLAAPSSTF